MLYAALTLAQQLPVPPLKADGEQTPILIICGTLLALVIGLIWHVVKNVIPKSQEQHAAQVAGIVKQLSDGHSETVKKNTEAVTETAKQHALVMMKMVETSATMQREQQMLFREEQD